VLGDLRGAAQRRVLEDQHAPLGLLARDVLARFEHVRPHLA
jgi:hypothetical protein